jgi:hypothetical protein
VNALQVLKTGKAVPAEGTAEGISGISSGDYLALKAAVHDYVDGLSENPMQVEKYLQKTEMGDLDKLNGYWRKAANDRADGVRELRTRMRRVEGLIQLLQNLDTFDVPVQDIETPEYKAIKVLLKLYFISAQDLRHYETIDLVEGKHAPLGSKSGSNAAAHVLLADLKTFDVCQTDKQTPAPSSWKKGNRVRIAKVGRQTGKEGTITELRWSGERLKVKMDDVGLVKGDIKSYLPIEVENLNSLPSMVEYLSNALVEETEHEDKSTDKWTDAEVATSIGYLGEEYAPYASHMLNDRYFKDDNRGKELLALDEDGVMKLVEDALENELDLADRHLMQKEHRDRLFAEIGQLNYLNRVADPRTLFRRSHSRIVPDERLLSPMMMLLDLKIENLFYRRSADLMTKTLEKFAEVRRMARKQIAVNKAREDGTNRLQYWCSYLASDSYFEAFIFLVIIAAAAVDGLQTYPAFENNRHIMLVDQACLLVFIIEMFIKILAANIDPFKGLWRYLFSPLDERRLEGMFVYSSYSLSNQISLFSPGMKSTLRALVTGESCEICFDCEYSPSDLDSRAQVMKQGSQFGKTGVVIDADWAGRIKIQMDEDGTIKSYAPGEVEVFGKPAARPASESKPLDLRNKSSDTKSENIVLRIATGKRIKKSEEEADKKEAEANMQVVWNRLDFVVVVSCVLGDMGFADLRMLRILRIVRLLASFEHLQNMVLGLGSGVYHAAPIMMLQFFATFIFALWGYDEFLENDPFHFLNGNTAFFSIYMFTVSQKRLANLQDRTV